MHFVDYEKLKKEMIGESIPNPMGEKSGHTVATPFENLVYSKIKEQIPLKTFRQYEYLNNLYSQSPDITKVKERQALIKSLSVEFLLNRGKDATKEWSNKNLFKEQQDDTADIIICDNVFFEIIDVKTGQISEKRKQAPNLISGLKLAKVCNIMLENKEFNSFTINYFDIKWKEEDNRLVCIDANVVNLFRANPESLYINWSSGRQIQVESSKLNQDFNGTKEEWIKKYLKHFSSRARNISDNIIKDFAIPFEKYIK